MRSDHWFYRIFRDLPELFFRLMGLPESEANAYSFEAVELKEVAFRLDGIYRPHESGKNIIFLEAQFYKADDFFLRWLTKICLYLLKNPIKEDWRALVLFDTRQTAPMAQPMFAGWLETGRIQAIFLDELREDSLEVALIKLAITRKDELLEKAKHLVDATQRSLELLDVRQKKLGLIEAFVVSNFPELTRQEILNMLQLNDIRDSNIFKEGVVEGKIEGKIEGEKGIISRLLANGRSLQEIAEMLGMKEKEVLAILSTPAN